jgi:hypothetical protein
VRERSPHGRNLGGVVPEPDEMQSAELREMLGARGGQLGVDSAPGSPWVGAGSAAEQGN